MSREAKSPAKTPTSSKTPAIKIALTDFDNCGMRAYGAREDKISEIFYMHLMTNEYIELGIITHRILNTNGIVPEMVYDELERVVPQTFISKYIEAIKTATGLSCEIVSTPEDTGMCGLALASGKKQELKKFKITAEFYEVCGRGYVQHILPFEQKFFERLKDLPKGLGVDFKVPRHARYQSPLKDVYAFCGDTKNYQLLQQVWKFHQKYVNKFPNTKIVFDVFDDCVEVLESYKEIPGELFPPNVEVNIHDCNAKLQKLKPIHQICGPESHVKKDHAKTKAISVSAPKELKLPDIMTKMSDASMTQVAVVSADAPKSKSRPTHLTSLPLLVIDEKEEESKEATPKDKSPDKYSDKYSDKSPPRGKGAILPDIMAKKIAVGSLSPSPKSSPTTISKGRDKDSPKAKQERSKDSPKARQKERKDSPKAKDSTKFSISISASSPKRSGYSPKAKAAGHTHTPALFTEAKTAPVSKSLSMEDDVVKNFVDIYFYFKQTTKDYRGNRDFEKRRNHFALYLSAVNKGQKPDLLNDVAFNSFKKNHSSLFKIHKQRYYDLLSKMATVDKEHLKNAADSFIHWIREDDKENLLGQFFLQEIDGEKENVRFLSFS